MRSIFDGIRKAGFRRGPNRWLGGICGGIAAALNAPVLLVRILMLIAFALPVIGWVAYVIVWLLTPWQDGSIPVERALFNGR